MQRPPSTSRATPVIIDALSEHKNTAVAPISSGFENLPKGIVDKNFVLISGVSSPKNDLRRGVSPATGFNALTLIPKGANSTAIDLVAVIIHPLVELYQLSRGLGLTPAVEAIFKITPYLFFFHFGYKHFSH